MTTIDIVICVLILLGAVIGYLKGFLKQLASLLGLIVGLVVARLLYAPLADKLCPSLFQSPTAAQGVAFVLIWIAVPIVCALVASLFTRALGHSLLGQLNRWLGALLGAAEFFAIVALLITALEYVDNKNEWISRKQKQASALYYPIDDLAQRYIPKAEKSMRDLIEDGLDNIDSLLPKKSER